MYSISFALERTTEFERFLEKFEQEASLNVDYQRILYALSKIRLYCLRITDEILILGNGDVKRTKV